MCCSLLSDRSDLSVIEVGDEMNGHRNMKRTGVVSPSTGDCSNSVVMCGKKKDNAYTWHRSCLSSAHSRNTMSARDTRRGEAGGGGGERV